MARIKIGWQGYYELIDFRTDNEVAERGYSQSDFTVWQNEEHKDLYAILDGRKPSISNLVRGGMELSEVEEFFVELALCDVD